MTLSKLSYELFPDVMYNGEPYLTDIEGKMPPLSVLFKSKFLGKDKFKLLILGAASLGKSSMLKMLRLDLLDWGVSFFSYDLKDLNNSAFALDGFKKEISRLPESILIILDGYDELYDERALPFVDKLIFNTTNPIMVASRHGKTVERKSVVKGNITDGHKREDPHENIELFGGYEQAQIDQLPDKRVNKLLNRHGIIVKQSIKELLHTTMFMSMLLTLDKGRLMEWGDIDNETEFMSIYFSELFKEKNTGNKSASKVLCDIGKEIYLTSVQKVMRDKKGDLPKIPTELNSIFYIKNDGKRWKIESDQIRFSNYAVSVYLCEEVKDLYDTNHINDATVMALLGYRINKDALIGAGRLIKKISNGKEIIKLFNDRYTKSVSQTYFNIVCIFTGYNNGVLNDIDKNEVFDLGKCVRKTTERFGFFTNNHGLAEIASKYFTKIKSFGVGCMFKITLGDWVTSVSPLAFRWVESCISQITIGKNVKRIGYGAFGKEHNLISIEVDKENKVFYEKEGCLIDRKKKAVVLAAYFADIPEGVIAISDYALPSMFGKIRIPDSVKFIGRHEAWMGLDEQGRYIVHIDHIVPIRDFEKPWEMNIYLGEAVTKKDTGPLVKKHTNSLCGIDINTLDKKTKRAFKYIRHTDISKRTDRMAMIFTIIFNICLIFLLVFLAIWNNQFMADISKIFFLTVSVVDWLLYCTHVLYSVQHVRADFKLLRYLLFRLLYHKRLNALMLIQRWLFNHEQDINIKQDTYIKLVGKKY